MSFDSSTPFMRKVGDGGETKGRCGKNWEWRNDVRMLEIGATNVNASQPPEC